MTWPLRVSGIINSSPKLREQGIDSYGNGVFSGIGCVVFPFVVVPKMDEREVKIDCP